jgi:hypothetical protein
MEQKCQERLAVQVRERSHESAAFIEEPRRRTNQFPIPNASDSRLQLVYVRVALEKMLFAGTRCITSSFALEDNQNHQ